MPRPHSNKVRLLVCGSADRGDDGASLCAVAGLLAGLPPPVLGVLEVRRCEQLNLDDLLDLPEGAAFVITDAVIGLPVGQIVTLALSALPDRNPATAPILRSSRVLPIGQLIAMAQAVRGAPLPGSFVGIGGRSFGFGRALGRPVRAALPAFRAAIELTLIEAAGGVPTASRPVNTAI